VRRRDTTWGGDGLALWLRALILCALVALAVPALAAAADEAPGSQAVLEETAPPPEEAPPAEPVSPSEGSGAVDEEPGSEPGAEPAPTPVEGGEVPEVPTAESLIPERPLTPSIGELEPELVAPDAPSVKPSVLVMKETPPPAAPPASGPPTALPGAPLFGVVPTTPDAPGGVARTGPAGGGAAPGQAVVPDRGPLTGVLASAARGALEPAAPAAPSRPEAGADLAGLSPAEDTPFAPRLAAPSGPAPAGSSLLAVLASYVLPGGGPVPASTTLLLLIQLAVILAALVAGPRPWRTDALVPTALLSARAGCKLAVSRPG